MVLEVQYVPPGLSAELPVVAVSWILFMDLAHFVSFSEAACQL